ncbi:hypothetical protein L484_002390 [Morus notabilis]|uniref:Uncharacterized protein n=1 Tax=Morus notabilis TaxID=981085 RepID=W9QNS3_9ROSA|nr:uncharacterized protein LOC21399570 [Morus notabilis]EXB36919.1 hypothetical protein L484_016524 [Morus notabilis]EXB46304.1 hypothetical protein L484_002390 [Morus notabilis]
MEEYYSDKRRENHDRDDDDDQELFTELDMAAAQQLMQLSDEENHSNKENIIDDHDHDEEVDQRLMKIINNRIPRLRSTLEKIEEIFGKEEEEEKDEEICGIRPPKKRKYRSLASIYRETKTTRDDDHNIITFGKTKKKKSS